MHRLIGLRALHAARRLADRPTQPAYPSRGSNPRNRRNRESRRQLSRNRRGARTHNLPPFTSSPSVTVAGLEPTRTGHDMAFNPAICRQSPVGARARRCAQAAPSARRSNLIA